MAEPPTPQPDPRPRNTPAHLIIRCGMAIYHATLTLVTALHIKHRPTDPAGKTILLTGTFYSDNWITAHIKPLAASNRCKTLYLVSAYPVPPTPNVVTIAPPSWLRRAIGNVPARLLTFAWTALRKRPDVVGGFHLLINGLLALLVGKTIGAETLYFSVGGPMEILDGGIHAENRLFGIMKSPDPNVETQLIRAIGKFDLIITMGTRAIAYLQQRGIDTTFHVVPGGIDNQRFYPNDRPPQTDLILVSRLVQIKRIDVFINAVNLVKESISTVTATLVGDGPLRETLEQQTRDLGLESSITFAGRQSNVEDYLRNAKIFVLTSDSEGLALSLMEAAMTGLPGIVSNVGDLPDLIENGVNGYLVPRRDAHAFAQRITELLADPAQLAQFAHAAKNAAEAFRPSKIARRWDTILA